jgi:phosphatidylglycerophosphatase A
MKLKRVIIYPKDIQRITGKSERYGRYLIRKIKEELNKEDHQMVTIDEFAKYSGIDTALIAEFID